MACGLFSVGVRGCCSDLFYSPRAKSKQVRQAGACLPLSAHSLYNKPLPICGLHASRTPNCTVITSPRAQSRTFGLTLGYVFSSRQWHACRLVWCIASPYKKVRITLADHSIYADCTVRPHPDIMADQRLLLAVLVLGCFAAGALAEICFWKQGLGCCGTDCGVFCANCASCDQQCEGVQVRTSGRRRHAPACINQSLTLANGFWSKAKGNAPICTTA